MKIKIAALALLTLVPRIPSDAAQDREVWSKTIDGYPVHIYADPSGASDPGKRGVLVLGTFSDAKDALSDARKLVNPSTGRPYDVIIGVGCSDNPESFREFLGEAKAVAKELTRVVADDHWNADRNAAAVKKGIEERFGGPLAARSVDMHSNGTPVGVTAIEQGAFRNVREMHLMGPDIGYAGKYVTEERLNSMKGIGVQEVHIHRTKGDIIHGLGHLTEGIVDGGKPLSVTLAQKTRDAVTGLLGLSASAGNPDSLVQNHEYEQATISGLFDAHFAARYVAQRAEASCDPELIRKTRDLMGPAEYDHAVGLRPDPTKRTIHIYNGRLLEDVLRESTPRQKERLVRELEEKAESARTLRERDGLLFMRDYVRAHVGVGPDAGDAKGVRIHFDERLLAEALEKGTPEENARLLEDLGRRLASARTVREKTAVLSAFENETKIRFRQGRGLRPLDGLVAVSLKSLAARVEPYAGRWNELPDGLRRAGGLTRLHGYVLSGDDILVLGRREDGVDPLTIDDWVVGFRAAWKENETPLVSLDPDPDNLGGDPRTRIQGIPGDSAFALAMLEADYAMKKIMGGVEPVDVPGYRTLKEILHDTRRAFISRFWLYPVQPAPGDIQMSADGSSVIFLGGTQVLSEEMRLLKEGLVGTGETFGPAEEAARSFSVHYESIAARKPIFRRLQGLFDVVLLGRVWRHRGLTSPWLDRLCSLPHRPVAITPTYPAIRVVVRREGNSEYSLSGGVQVKVGAGRRTWLALEDEGLAALRAQCGKVAASGEVSSRLTQVSVHAVAPSARPDASSRDFGTAVRTLFAGDLEASLAATHRLLKGDPWDGDAFVLRALIHLRRGDPERARRDARRARELDPDSLETAAATSEILFQCGWISGDPDGALRELESSLRNDANGTRAHVARGEALSLLNRSDEARKAYEKAAQLDPGSALAYARLALLELTTGRTLAAKPWLRKADALNPACPEVRLAQASWEVATVRPDRAEKIARELWENKAAGPTVRLQALTVLASVAAAREKWDRVDEYIELMSRLSARSPEVLVVAAEIAFTWGERTRARAYLEKAERMAPRHPLVIELARKIGR